MPRSFEESTGYPTIHEALKPIRSADEAQMFFATYVAHLMQTEGWGGSGLILPSVAKKLIAGVLKPEQKHYWEELLKEDIK